MLSARSCRGFRAALQLYKILSLVGKEATPSRWFCRYTHFSGRGIFHLPSKEMSTLKRRYALYGRLNWIYYRRTGVIQSVRSPKASLLSGEISRIATLIIRDVLSPHLGLNRTFSPVFLLNRKTSDLVSAIKHWPQSVDRLC